MRKGQEEVEVLAPVVISNAGIFNTFQKFLPSDVNAKPGKCFITVYCPVSYLSEHVNSKTLH